jgi:hypothetical protein
LATLTTSTTPLCPGVDANTKEAHAPLVPVANGKRVAFLGYDDFPPRSFAAGPTSLGTAWLGFDYYPYHAPV